MTINRGDVYWLDATQPDDSATHSPNAPSPDLTIRYPYVVLQEDVINHSRVKTVVCALTSNLKRATEPGNVLLEAGEANLPRPSVVVVSQIDTVDKTHLGPYIGTLSQARVEQILAGIRFQQIAFFARDRTN
jgi:mRNA interferase MazF